MHSDRPLRPDGRAFHVPATAEQVAGRSCLLPGDPDRCDLIASLWTDAQLVGEHREHRVFTGTYRGAQLCCCSTGVGGPSAANALEELAMLGVKRFVRVGTTGSLKKSVAVGHVVINTAAVRHDGTSDAYAPSCYPAVADFDLTLALRQACLDAGLTTHLGICCSTASFYAGQGRPGLRSLLLPGDVDIQDRMTALGVTNFEMEAATLFTLGQIFGLQVGAVCHVIANRVTKELDEGDIIPMLRAACDALSR